MARRVAEEGIGAWVSASDLADYTYCPRSFYYRHHPPAQGPTRASEVSSSYGERFHRAELTASLRAERHLGGWIGAAVASVLVLGILAWGFFAGWWGI